MQRYFTKAAILDGNLVDRMKGKHVLSETNPQVTTPACCKLWRLVTSKNKGKKAFSSLFGIILVRKKDKPLG